MNRYESTRKVGILGAIGNLFLLIIKVVVGLTSNSQALIADALNSAGDVFSSVMTFIGNKIASTPQDENHNFGHGKAEYIFSMLISIFMIIIASKILIDSVSSIIIRHEFVFSFNLIVVCIITIAIKYCLYLYCYKQYKKHPNILIKSCMKDHKNDMILTLGTLLSVILSRIYYFFDGLIGGIISLYILENGIIIFLESYKILMDISLESREKDKIIKFILAKKDISSVTEFDTVATGYKYIAIITIEVDGDLKTFESHDIADKLEKEIPKEFRKIYKAIVHVNPKKINKNELRKKYQAIRDNLQDKKGKCQLIIKNLRKSSFYQEAKTIALYSSIKSEVDTNELFLLAKKDQKIVVYPKVLNKNQMVFLKVEKSSDLSEGEFGIKEPKYNEKNLVTKDEIELMVVPGICFDKDKNRLGYGGGYYDKFLRNTSFLKVGLTFSDCLTTEILPTLNTDIKMDYIITDKEIYQ